jgi:hypothetical protein
MEGNRAMESWTIADAYPRPILGNDAPLVVNRSHLSPESGGLNVTVSTPNLQWGDYIHLYWDGEFVDKVYVYAWTYSCDFRVSAEILGRHAGRAIEAFYVVQAAGSPTLDGMSRSPSLVLDAKFTRPGGDDTDSDTPYVNDNLKPIQGADRLAKGKDLTLTVPVWENMEAGANLTIYWGEKEIQVDASAVTAGSPVNVVVPWALIDGAPQGIVSVTYAIRDRVGNASGNAPAVDIPVVFAPVLPLPAFQYAVDKMGRIDVDLATKMAAASDDRRTTPLVVEYDDAQTGDRIIVSLQGTTSTDVRVNPAEFMQIAAPAAPEVSVDGLQIAGSASSEHPQPAANPPAQKRYVFDVPLAWLGFLVGGGVFCSYVVKRAGVDFRSETRTRRVVGTLLRIPAPFVVEMAEGSDLLDLNSVAGTIPIAVEVHPLWPRKEMKAFLEVRSKESKAGFDVSKELLASDEDGLLTWELSAENFLAFPQGDITLVVSFVDSQGASVRSSERTLTFLPLGDSLTWPSLAIAGRTGDRQLALEDLTGDSLHVTLPRNALFRAGDQVSLNWGETTSSTLTIGASGDSLAFDVPISQLKASAGSTVDVSYTVTRGTEAVGPQPAQVLKLSVAAPTVGALPAPSTTAATGGVIDVEKAKDGIVLTVPTAADVLRTDTIKFEIRASDGTWRSVTAAVGDANVAKVTPDELIPFLGGIFGARYTVTRSGSSKTSEELSLTLGAYTANDARLPKPAIKEAMQKPGNIGNPYIDAKTLSADPLTVVVPRWPFAREGQLISVSMKGTDSSGQFPTTKSVAEKHLVSSTEVEQGAKFSLPRAWLLGQPKVAATDIQIEVIIERPLASEGFRFMTLPVAVINVVNLNETSQESGGESGSDKPNGSETPPPRAVDPEGCGPFLQPGSLSELLPSPLRYMNLYGDDTPGNEGKLSGYAGSGSQFAGMTRAGIYNRYVYKRGVSGRLLLLDVKMLENRIYRVYLHVGPQEAGAATPAFRLHVQGFDRPVDFQRQPFDTFIAGFQAPGSTAGPVRLGLEVVPPVTAQPNVDTVALKVAIGRYS